MTSRPPSSDGIEPGNANYLREPGQPALHDRLTAGDRLAQVDLQIVMGELSQFSPGVVADFGCGTGRTFWPLARAGWQVLGIDLSRPMLEAAKQRWEGGKLNSTAGSIDLTRPWLVQASLAGLNCIADQSLDAGICLFSTLGMLRGRKARGEFLRAARRTIRPGGPLIVHAHNVWHQRRFPGGWRWLARSALSSLVGRTEFGDRWANTAGVRGLFIHSFRFRGLSEELRESGWDVVRVWQHFTPESKGNAGGSESILQIQAPVIPELIGHGSKWNAVGWTVACMQVALRDDNQAGTTDSQS